MDLGATIGEQRLRLQVEELVKIGKTNIHTGNEWFYTFWNLGAAGQIDYR